MGYALQCVALIRRVRTGLTLDVSPGAIVWTEQGEVKVDDDGQATGNPTWPTLTLSASVRGETDEEGWAFSWSIISPASTEGGFTLSSSQGRQVTISNPTKKSTDWWTTGMIRCRATKDGRPTMVKDVPVALNALGTWKRTVVNDTATAVSLKKVTWTDTNGKTHTSTMQSAIQQSSESISEKVSGMDNGLKATGVDIENHKITATTDNFEVCNNSGTPTFSIDKDGNIVGAGDAYFKGTITGSVISGSTITSTSSDGKSTTKIEGGKLTTNDLEATNGKFSGELSGVSGTFTELRAESDNLNSVRILMEGDATIGGRLTFVGNIGNMAHTFYGGNIYSTGTEFGHRGRTILLINNNTFTLVWTGYPTDPPYVPTMQLSMLNDKGTNCYKVPLFNLGNFISMANKPVDVIVFNNSTGGLYYSLFSDCIGKGVDIINANDDHELYIASIAGYFRLSGGACMRGVYIGTRNIYPPVSYLGAGWFFFGYNDMNW